MEMKLFYYIISILIVLTGGSVEFQEIGDRFATLFECSLNFPSDSY